LPTAFDRELLGALNKTTAQAECLKLHLPQSSQHAPAHTQLSGNAKSRAHGGGIMARVNPLKSLLALLLCALALVGCVPTASPDRIPTAPSPRLPGLNQSAYVTLAGERVYYEVGGSGSPVVLVHGIGAGNSSHLWRQNTAALARQHRVYAFDWPGFARSGARPIRYTNDLYVEVLKDFLKQVVGQPSALVGGSLGSDYAIRVAVEEPALVTKLLVSNPTGYDANLGFNREITRDESLYKLFSESLVGSLTFSLINSESGLDFFLYNYVYLNWRLVTPEITNIYMENLKGENKQYAPFAFFSGFLDQPIGDLWPKVTQPTLLVWGSDDLFTSVRFADAFVKARPVAFETLKGRAIPYDEDFETFNRLTLNFLR
jgi:pimeloyl-ACP methyl ester carboxylesterase